MKEMIMRMMIIVFGIGVIGYAEGFEIINETLLREERRIYGEMNEMIDRHLRKLGEIEERNKYASSNRREEVISDESYNDDDDDDGVITNIIPLSTIQMKKISKIASFNNDKIEHYHIIDLHKSHIGKTLFKSQSTASSSPSAAFSSNETLSSEIKDHLLILSLNSTMITLSKQTPKSNQLLSSLQFTFQFTLSKVDFSSFEDDSTILILSTSNEIFLLKTDIQIQGTTFNDLSAELFIPTRKSFGINIKQDCSVVSFLQHKLHGNKYIVIAYQKGQIFVLNKDLEMKSAIDLHSPLHKIHLFNGILFAIKGKEIVFMNLLGGNAILLSCHNHYDIIDVFYYAADNLLFYIDSGNRVMVMNVKLSISKSHENECSTVYYYQLPSFAEVDAYTRMISLKAEVFVVTMKYIGVIDLNVLSTKGLMMNHYAIYQMKPVNNTTTAHANDSNDRDRHELYASNTFGLFYLLHDSHTIYKIENDPLKSTKQQQVLQTVRTEGSTDIITPNQSSQRTDGRVECNGNLICKIFFNTATNNKNTIFIVYALVIILISISVIYYQRSRSKEEKKKKEYEEDKKKTNEDTNIKLQEMYEQIRKIEQYQQMNPMDPEDNKGNEPQDESVNEDEEEDDYNEEIEEEYKEPPHSD